MKKNWVSLAVLIIALVFAAMPATADKGGGGHTPPSNPDGGGYDRPGWLPAQGDQHDSNNGSGNDPDCQDDNRGQGIPGHCRPTAVPPTVVVVPTATPTQSTTISTVVPPTTMPTATATPTQTSTTLSTTVPATVVPTQALTKTAFCEFCIWQVEQRLYIFGGRLTFELLNPADEEAVLVVKVDGEVHTVKVLPHQIGRVELCDDVGKIEVRLEVAGQVVFEQTTTIH